METPNKITIEEAARRYQAYITEEMYLGPNGLPRHEKCGRVLQITIVSISIHDDCWHDQCVGESIVQELVVPYCLVCEPKPALYGCIHVSVDSSLIQLPV